MKTTCAVEAMLRPFSLLYFGWASTPAHLFIKPLYKYGKRHVVTMYQQQNISASTRAVIGQFSGPYSTVRPAKNWSCFCCQNVSWFTAKCSWLFRQRYNKYLTNLVFSVRTVSYGSSFFPFDLSIDGEETRSATYSTALELGSKRYFTRHLFF